MGKNGLCKCIVGKKYGTTKEVSIVSNADKLEQIMIDLKDSLDHGEIEDALTLLCMIKNAEQLKEWILK